MSITLFEKHDFRGDSFVVSQDTDDLQNFYAQCGFRDTAAGLIRLKRHS